MTVVLLWGNPQKSQIIPSNRLFQLLSCIPVLPCLSEITAQCTQGWQQRLFQGWEKAQGRSRGAWNPRERKEPLPPKLAQGEQWDGSSDPQEPALTVGRVPALSCETFPELLLSPVLRNAAPLGAALAFPSCLEVSATATNSEITRRDADCTSLSLGSDALSTSWGFLQLDSSSSLLELGFSCPPSPPEEGQAPWVSWESREVQGCVFPQGRVCPVPWGWAGITRAA